MVHSIINENAKKRAVPLMTPEASIMIVAVSQYYKNIMLVNATLIDNATRVWSIAIEV